MTRDAVAAEITRFLTLLVQLGDVFEVRAPKCLERRGATYTSTVSGYFTHASIEVAAGLIAELDESGLAPGLYITLNPVKSDLLARAANRLKRRAPETTADGDIVVRRWLLIDVDPVRPSGVSATDEELELARQRASAIWVFLSLQDWPEPIVEMSGNGFHLLYCIDLPVDDADLVRRVLVAIADHFDDARVRIDRSVHNPARITKIIGTMARKGDDLPAGEGITARPHRRSKLINVPEELCVVPTEALEALVESAKPPPPPSPPDQIERFPSTPDGVRVWLEQRGVPVKGVRRNGTKTMILLERCPIDPEIVSTGSSDIAVLVGDDGMLAYCNRHNRGENFTWSDLRRVLDPEYAARGEKYDDVDLSGIMNRRETTATTADTDPPAEPSDKPPDPGPFPDHLLNVPGFIGDVIAFNVQTSQRPQPVLALAAAISLQATLAARKVRDERGNRTNLYCVGLAPSGAGKDHARKVNKNLLFQAGLGAHEGSEDLASDAGLVTAVDRQPAVLFQIDEFGRFLRTIGDPKRAPHLFNVLTALMKLYSSADTVFRGKAYADAKRSKVIDQPCVNVYATTVPEHFFESLTADSLNDGFIARLLVFEAEATPPRQRSAARDVPEHLLDAARWWGEFQPGGNLAREHPEPAVIPCTTEAANIFDELAERVDAELAQSNVEGRSLWARAEEKACRLALVYACSANREKPVIDENAARWACDLSVHMTRRMLLVAGQWVADGQFDARQKRVVRIIRKAGGRISRRELSRRTQWLTQRERQEVIENLLETEQVEQITEETAGRPKVIYVLC